MVSVDSASKAADRLHKRNMGKRYIEVFQVRMLPCVKSSTISSLLPCVKHYILIASTSALSAHSRYTSQLTPQRLYYIH